MKKFLARYKRKKATDNSRKDDIAKPSTCPPLSVNSANIPSLPLSHLTDYCTWKLEAQRLIRGVLDRTSTHDNDWAPECTEWLLKQVPQHIAQALAKVDAAYFEARPWETLGDCVASCQVCSKSFTTLNQIRVAANFGCEDCYLIMEVLRDFGCELICQPHEDIQVERVPALGTEIVFLIWLAGAEEKKELFSASRVQSKSRAC